MRGALWHARNEAKGQASDRYLRLMGGYSPRTLYFVNHGLFEQDPGGYRDYVPTTAPNSIPETVQINSARFNAIKAGNARKRVGRVFDEN